MKNKWDNRFALASYVTSTEQFKMLFYVTIFFVLYGVVGITGETTNVFDAVLVMFQFPLFNILFFSFLCFHTFQTCHIFYEEFENYQIRLKTRKNYLKEFVKLIIISNTIYILIFLLILIIVLNFKYYGAYGTHLFGDYSVNNMIYCFFYLTRYMLYAIVISCILGLLYRQGRERQFICIVLLFISGLYLFSTNAVMHTFTFLPWHYFTSVMYESFQIDVINTGIYFVCLVIVLLICFTTGLKRGEDR